MWRGLIMMLGCLLGGGAQALDDGNGSWYVQTSVWTKHFSPDPEHNNRQDLLGVERQYDNDWLWGGATFRNSFSQRSVYAYGGWQFFVPETPFYAKLTAGLLWGYRGEYRDKIPLNRLGVAPAILPSVGINWNSIGAELVVFGTAGTMVNVGYRF